jgi:hypothetical protein
MLLAPFNNRGYGQTRLTGCFELMSNNHWPVSVTGKWALHENL